MSKNRYASCEMRQHYARTWKADLWKTCCEAPCYWCFSAFCPSCASYCLRKQALYNDMSRYICCNGACPCSGRMGEKSCPEFCLCLEVFFCFAQSVVTTRWMIQDELQIQSTPCDNCIIGTMVFFQYLSCVCDIVACITGSEEIHQLAAIIDCIADLLWCTVCACMLTQHKIELDQRDKGGAYGASPPPMAPPPIQSIPAGYPAPGQYPPPPGQYPPPAGYPPQGQYPPPAQYPPQGYPDAQYQYPPPGQYPPQMGR